MVRSLALALATGASILLGLASPQPATAHSMTKQEALAHAERQEAMYHCLPAVQAYTLARKRHAQQQQQHPRLQHHNHLGAQAIFAAKDPTATPALFLQDPASADPRAAALLSHNLAADAALELSKIRNSTCVLAPEVTEGPYFHHQGHPIRRHMAEYQLGLPFIMNIGVIDVETCKPAENILVDVWMANATGYYSGHPDPAPQLKDEKPATSGARKGLLSAYPRTTERENWLRAAFPTDKNGIAQFTSIFPGFYTGRATHVHARVYTDWTPLPNGSYVGGPLAHIGQFFFDDELNEAIDKMHPYSLNPIRDTWGRTRNWNDGLGIYDAAGEGGYKPVFDIDFLGHVVSQGLIGYVTMGVNLSHVHAASAWDPQSSRPKFSGQ